MKKYWRKFQSLSPPIRWFALSIIALVILAILSAPESKPVDYRSISYLSTADSRLYFKNIRSYYYHIDRHSKAPMLIYSLKRRSPERDSLSLSFNIVQYPGAEEIYIYSEIGKSFEQYDSLRVIFEKYSGHEDLQGINSEGHFRIAAKTYTSLLEEKAVFLMNYQDTISPLFQDKASRLDAEITLEDYFKLTLKN